MKKIYTFFALLLLCAVTAVAQTTVTIVDGTLTNPPYDTYGTRSSDKTTFTSNAASGMAGITIVAPVIDRAQWWSTYYCLALKPAAAQTTENVTVTVPDGYIIQDYSITLQAVSSSYPYDVTINGTTSTITGAAEQTFNPTINAKTTTFTIKQNESTVGNWLAVKRWTITVAVAIDVTYNLYDASDLTTVIATETVSQPINSAISIPSSLTSTYNTNYYTTTTSGTIGTADCTIDVTRTLNNNAIVTNLANLSNDKAYTITCVRGTLTTDGSTIASTIKSTYTAKNFAIITKDDAYYLYSIDDEKYVASDGTLATYPTDAAFKFQADLLPTFLFKYGSNYINTSGGLDKGSAIDNWSTPDDGNQFVIIEAGDFDPTDALEKFTDRAPYYEALNAAITAAGNVSFGTTLHTYVKSANFDSALATAQSTYADEDATIEELTAATQALTTAIDACELNMPTEGMFLRITSCHETILSGTPASGRLSLTTNADASTIFYFDGTKLLNYGNGVYANGRDAGSVGGDGISYWFEESTMKTGAYAIRFNPDGGSNRFLYAWGTDKNYADQNGTDHANCVFTLEEVTELPITLHSVDGTNYFATFSAPVAVEINGATLNNVTPKANSISYKAVDTKLLPTNTGVLLTGTSASATAYVVTDEVADASYGLQAYDAAFTVEEADQTSKLFLGKGSQSGKVGFYALGSAKTNGFKAYFVNSTGEAKEGFDLVDANETTGVESIDGLTPNPSPNGKGSMYNLQGQRVVKAQKGVFIQNGKKVVVK